MGWREVEPNEMQMRRQQEGRGDIRDTREKRSRNVTRETDRVAIRQVVSGVCGVWVKCRWMEAITICQSKYKIIIIVMINKQITKIKETKNNKYYYYDREGNRDEKKEIKVRHAPAKSAAGGQIRSERGLMRFGEASSQSPGAAIRTGRVDR